MTAQLTGTGIGFQLAPTSPTSQTVSSGNAASYSLELTPVNGSTGTADHELRQSSAKFNLHNFPCKCFTGYSIEYPGRDRNRRGRRIAGASSQHAGLASLADRISNTHHNPHRNSTRQGNTAFLNRRLLLMIALMGLIGSISACGKGGGLLGTGTPPPLPVTSTTPPGAYTVTVSAAAGGLNKSVSLTVQVQ